MGMLPSLGAINRTGANPFDYSHLAFDYATFLGASSPSIGGDAWLARPTGHFQDSARTTVATVGDPLGSVTGEAGQFNAQQVLSGSRPVLRADAGKYYFDPAGSPGGQYLIAGTTSSWNYLHNGTGDGYAIYAVRYGSSSNPNQLFVPAATFDSSSANVGWMFFFDDRASVPYNNALRIFISRGQLGAPAVNDSVEGSPVATPPNTDLVLEFIKQGTAFNLYVNRIHALAGTLSSPSAANSTSALHLLNSASLGTDGDFRTYGIMVCNRVPNPTERAAIQSDMAYRCANPPF